MTCGSEGDVAASPASAHAPALACHMSMYAHGSWLVSFPLLLFEMEQPFPARSSGSRFAGPPPANIWLPGLPPGQLHELPICGLQSLTPATPLSCPVTSAT